MIYIHETDGWMDGWMDEHIDEHIDMDLYKYIMNINVIFWNNEKFGKKKEILYNNIDIFI